MMEHDLFIIFLGIQYGSILVFPLFIFLGWRFSRESILGKCGIIVLSLFGFLFLWARFLEPNLLLVRYSPLPISLDTRIALVADFHYGIYNNGKNLSRIVKRINQENPDVTLIAGDFTYWPNNERLQEFFTSFKNLKAPAYAVFGNHDSMRPGPKIQNSLKKVLQDANVYVIENEVVSLDNNLILIGLGDYWAGASDISLLDDQKEKDTVLVLTHNPDTTLTYVNKNADLTFSGHTHCGQIRIPWLYKKVIPTSGPFDKGFHSLPQGKVFTTCGLGQVGLPMRFLNPPVIDILGGNNEKETK